MTRLMALQVNLGVKNHVGRCSIPTRPPVFAAKEYMKHGRRDAGDFDEAIRYLPGSNRFGLRLS